MSGKKRRKGAQRGMRGAPAQNTTPLPSKNPIFRMQKFLVGVFCEVRPALTAVRVARRRSIKREAPPLAEVAVSSQHAPDSAFHILPSSATMSAPQSQLDGDGAGPSSVTGASSEARAPTGGVPPVQPARAPPVEPAPVPVDAVMAERGDAAHAANVASAQPSAVQAFGKVMAETLEYERLVATLPSLATSLSVFQHKPRVAVREVMERLASLAARGGVTRPGRDAAPGGRLQSIDRQVQRLQNEVTQLRRRLDGLENAPAPPPPNRCGGGGCCGASEICKFVKSRLFLKI